MDTIWARRIRELEAAEWSLKSIGEAVGLTTSAVSELKSRRTKEPRLSAALKLESLHQKVCGQKRAA